MNLISLLVLLPLAPQVTMQSSGGPAPLSIALETEHVYVTPTAATFVIAAADSVRPFRADLRCDGVDDQLQLQAALDGLPAFGGRVVLLEGTYSWFDTQQEPLQIPDDVEIAGMGRGTRILVGADVPAFVLRNVTGVRLLDFQVSLELGAAHTEDVFRIEAAALGERTFYNSIERVYVASRAPGTPQYTGLRLLASDEGGGSGGIPGVYGNAFRDLFFERTGTAIALETAGSDQPWVNGNAFEAISVYQFVTGVEFLQPSPVAAGANRNRFLDVKLQTADVSLDGFKGISRRGNVFLDCLVWDWHLATSPNTSWSVAASAVDTLIHSTATPPDLVDDGLRTTLLSGGTTRIGGEVEFAGESLHLGPDGLLGIGTSTPASKLSLGRNYTNTGVHPETGADIDGDYEADAITFFDHNNGFIAGEVRAKIAVFQEYDPVNDQIWADVTGLGFFTETGGPGQNLAERLRIDTWGRVGVGTSLPTARLDVAAAAGDEQLRLRASFTPSGSNDPSGEVGSVCWDGGYVYVKTGAGWRRAELSSW